jgi:hypothetical protein
MVPAGLMPDGATQVLLQGDAADAIGAGITVEPCGGGAPPPPPPRVWRPHRVGPWVSTWTS